MPYKDYYFPVSSDNSDVFNLENPSTKFVSKFIVNLFYNSSNIEGLNWDIHTNLICNIPLVTWTASFVLAFAKMSGMN